jgi:hypothetical protein
MRKMCASCWLFSRMCITMHGSESIYRGRPNKMGTIGIPQFQELGSFTFCSVGRFSLKDLIGTHSLMIILFVHIGSRPLYCSARSVTPRRKTRVFWGGRRGAPSDHRQLSHGFCVLNWIINLRISKICLPFCLLISWCMSLYFLLYVFFVSVVCSTQDCDRNVLRVFWCPIFIFRLQ